MYCIMDKCKYVYAIADKYFPMEVEEIFEDGTFFGDYPHMVSYFCDMVSGVFPRDFLFTYEKFCEDKELMWIIEAYNERIAEDNAKTELENGVVKQSAAIDKEALYYAVMFVYNMVENQYTNAMKKPDTIRQQLQNLKECLTGARRFTVIAETLESSEDDGKKKHLFVERNPVEISGRTLIKNLINSIEVLLDKPALIGDKGHEVPLDFAEIDFDTDDRVTYAATKKAKKALEMLKYLFGTLNLPDMRISKMDNNGKRSYSINRMIAIILNMLYSIGDRTEKAVKGLMSKEDFNPNTLIGW